MLYTIGDLHLSLDKSKPMDIFGTEWEGHAEKIQQNFAVADSSDVTVICGDLTWGIDMESCLQDFLYIDALPGNKIILKGNHDYWWTTASSAMKFFAKHEITTISILNNNCYYYNGVALCGTRGWMYSVGSETEHDKKMMNREAQRLENSLKAADSTAEKFCFLHYPPIYGRFRADKMIELMKIYGVTRCYYGHIHGPGRAYAVEGTRDGIEYKLVSADHAGFKPIAII